jgi:hypothetical protein
MRKERFMKKILLFIAVAGSLSACGGGGGGGTDGGNGVGTVSGIPPAAVPAGQGAAFVSSVLAITDAANPDMISDASAQQTYDSYAETSSDTTLPDTFSL